MFGGADDELADDVVGIVGVSDRVAGAQEHLKEKIRDFRAQLAEAIPRVFLEEAHGSVEGGAAPHFHAEKLRRQMRGRRCDGQKIVAAYPRREQRLVCVAEGGVREKEAFLLAHPLGEFFRAKLDQLLAGAGSRGLAFGIFGDDRLGKLSLGIDFSFDVRAAVDDHLRDDS